MKVLSDRVLVTIIDVKKEEVSKGGIYIIEDIQDIDKDRSKFEDLGFTILDRRHIKNRYDDVLAYIKNESPNN